MREVDVRTDDGRVLHAYDMGPTGRSDELVVFWERAASNSGSGGAPVLGVPVSGGSATTVPATEGRVPIRPRRSRLRPLMLARLPINWASTVSLYSATPVVGHVPWPAEPCFPTA